MLQLVANPCRSFFLITRTVGKREATAAAVPSRDALSTTMTSVVTPSGASSRAMRHWSISAADS